MALQIGNKTYRNIPEQIQKNKEDIATHYEIDRTLSSWGIKVLGVYATSDLLPTENNEYGDAYAVGTATPYTYYVWTRANSNVGQETDYWLNVGALSLVGPQGPQGIQGIQGIQGVRGSSWTSHSNLPTASQPGNVGDQWLETTTGDVYQKGTSTWTRTGNIKGPQGVQGPQGMQGIQGIQGPQGPQGAKGDTGSSFQIGGLLDNADLLPTPTESNRHIGYAVKNADGTTYDLYVAVGTDSLMWVNMGRVEGVEGPQGPVGPQGPAGADIQVVNISGIPSTATSGTLTQEQVNTLLAHPSNYIQFFNENFYPQDVETSEGYIVYSHVGIFEGNTKIKTITLTIATLSWVLSEVEIGVSEPPITLVDTLPEANEENFEKGKIYSTGALLQYISKEMSDGEISRSNSLPKNLNGTSAAAVGTDVYVFGGTGSSGRANTIYKYDTTTNTITTMSTTLLEAVADTSAAAVGSDIYIFGGQLAYPNRSKKIYKYSTTTNTITTMSATLPVAIYNTSAAAVGTNVYIFGGDNGSNRVKTIYKYDTTTNTITTMSTTLPVVLDRASAAAVGNDIYIFGGYGDSSRVNTIYKYSTTTNTITTMSTTLPTEITETSAAAVGTDIYIFGGYSSSKVNTIYKYDTVANTITTMSATLPVAIYNTSAAAVGTNVYIFGGDNGSSDYSNTIYQFSLGFNYTFKTIATE